MSDGSPDRENRTIGEALALAAAWAMIATAAEFIVHLVTRYALHDPVYQGLDVLWAKPLVNLLLFLPPALLLRFLPARFFVACLAFPAMAAPLLLLLPGSAIPMIILAAGMGTQLGVLLHKPRGRDATVRIGKALAAMFVVVTLVTQVQRLVAERRQPVVAAAADAPNVLLIILDTVRAASLSLYGGRAMTPQIDALAADGVAFDRAVSTAPWTLPSHASLFTGLWPHEHGADWRTPLDGRAPTLAEVLAGQGYRTGGFVANLVFTSREHGLQRGFQVYRDYRRSPGALLRSSALVQTITTSRHVRRLAKFRELAGRKKAHDVNEEFLAWAGKSGERPWFAFLNYFDAHEPYLPSPPWQGRYSSGLPPRRFDLQRFWHVEGGLDNWKVMSPAEVEAEQAAYEEAITGLDAAVGAMLDELRRRGELERTLVVLTSDHGELFGEHQTYTHGNSIYWRAIHVPLVMSWPGRVPQGVRVAEAVTLRDVPSTILSLVRQGAASALPGTPLPFGATDSGRARTPAVSRLTAEQFMADDPAMRNGTLQALVGAEWQYTRAANGHEDVFWTGAGVKTPDSVVTDPVVRAAITDSARATLAAARVPAPRDSTR